MEVGVTGVAEQIVHRSILWGVTGWAARHAALRVRCAAPNRLAGAGAWRGCVGAAGGLPRCNRQSGGSIYRFALIFKR
jgi:hypothetical protein